MNYVECNEGVSATRGSLRGGDKPMGIRTTSIQKKMESADALGTIRRGSTGFAVESCKIRAVA